jgi:GNAT superfamily N-acetyltransferase
MAAQQLAVRQAETNELDTVMALLQERIDWLRSRGSDQWSTSANWQAKFEPALDAGHVWLLLDGQDPIGTITVEFQGDRDFWSQEECAEPAAYLSKLAIQLDHAGDELGALLTDWACDYAYRRGCKFVRLDAWRTNDELHEYYATRGWKYLRTVENPGRNSGSLFQLAAKPLARAQRSRLHEEVHYMVLDNTRGGPESTEPDPAGNWHANHVHRGGMRVHYDVAQRAGEAMFVDFMRYRLRHDQEGWQLDAVNGHFTDWRRQGSVLAVNAPVDEGLSYIVSHQELATGCRMIITPMPVELGTVCIERPQKTIDGEQR